MERKRLERIKRRTSGITLIALVVTIVILIILVSISVNIMLKSRMLDKTIDARDDFENNQSTVKREVIDLLNDTRNPFPDGD